ncbi:hypothetical protein B0A52_06675 [Exophiala mesophila]|uniref:Uncharacterized protein n=1 Tax=Exophiala mesophila TaxID=212818 RepID=A0A438N1L1_EXOME|nr:hypothetical protein B0A52_06675 [Exophiala mesophila]
MSLPSRSPPSFLPTRSGSNSPIDHEAMMRMVSSAPGLELLDMDEVLDAYRRVVCDGDEDTLVGTEPDDGSDWRSATPIPYITDFTDNEDFPGGPVLDFRVYQQRAASLLQISLRLCCMDNLSDMVEGGPEDWWRLSRQLAIYTYQALSFLEAMGESHDMIIRMYARALFIRDLYGSGPTVNLLEQTDRLVNACYLFARASDNISQVLTASDIDTVERLQWGFARIALRTVSALNQRGVSPNVLNNAIAYRWMGLDRAEALAMAREIELVRLRLDDVLPGGDAQTPRSL